MSDPEVIVVGSFAVAAELRAADVLVLEQGVRRLEFDPAEDRWELGTADGRHYRPRVVVLGAAAQLANTVALPMDWATGKIGFLGVALHGFPNLFLHTASGPEGTRQLHYIRHCLELLRRTAGTRIEVRSATQHEYLRRTAHPGADTWRRRALRRPDPHHYDLTVPADREPPHDYSGPAMLDAPGVLLPVQVTLSGHPDPIDGQFHWYGRISATPDLPDPGRATVTLTLPGHHPATGRLQERDPWGNLRITGTGTPPFPRDAV
ncbi:DUF4873 domain-containing protein [Nocardia sp. NPDC050712]|uniref:DUF4873 domain-containing protein n=1 Tax=Nocardia sp. NPDC050712 TaxID=3155518 RepID=UPI0033F7999D